MTSSRAWRRSPCTGLALAAACSDVGEPTGGVPPTVAASVLPPLTPLAFVETDEVPPPPNLRCRPGKQCRESCGPGGLML